MNVVVIDDDEGIGLLCKFSLESRHNVDLYQNPAEAIEQADWPRVDVLVTDVMMPGMSGGQVIEWVAENAPHVKRIVLTAKDPSALEWDSFSQAHEILSKPFNPDELREAVGV